MALKEITGNRSSVLENIFFSPALVISEDQLDRMISITRDAVKAVTGPCRARDSSVRVASEGPLVASAGA